MTLHLRRSAPRPHPPRRRSARAPAAAAGLALAVGLLGARAAHAGPELAADADAAIALAPSHVSTGIGGALRLGYKVDLTLLTLTPEIGGGYHVFGGDLSPGVFRGFVGGRLAVGAIVRPGVFAHVGYANVSYSAFDNVASTSRSAPTFDAGVSFDVTVIPLVDLGLHAAYTTVSPGNGFAANRWIATGVHVALVF